MHCIGLSTSCFVHFPDLSSSIHNSDYVIDNLLLGSGLGEVGEGLAALELGILDHTCMGEEVLVCLCFSIE